MKVMTDIVGHRHPATPGEGMVRPQTAIDVQRMSPQRGD
jgi:hypothetical protein